MTTTFTPEVLNASCHCGAVAFTVQLSDGFNTVRRCNCSFCRMRGAVAVSAPLSGIRVIRGQDKLSEYRFNTGAAVHFFCSVCGIYTFHQRRSNSGQYGVNVACIENVSPFDFACVEVMDGVNHPRDGVSQGVVGYLRYEDVSNGKSGENVKTDKS
ncbi:GFA family protein [Phytobacter sp. V91]|uniref:GFA family protein n=1 Tax=Phytobacter sp. V91 TaxID=3369425 RepID=UPI003F63B263